MKQEITLDEIMSEFFSRFYNILMIETFKKLTPKEEAGQALDEIFKITEKSFQGFSEQIAKSDLNFYLEYKKQLGLVMDQTKDTIIRSYDKIEIEEAKSNLII